MNHSTLGAFRTSPDVTSPATCNFTTQVLGRARRNGEGASRGNLLLFLSSSRAFQRRVNRFKTPTGRLNQHILGDPPPPDPDFSQVSERRLLAPLSRSTQQRGRGRGGGRGPARRCYTDWRHQRVTPGRPPVTPARERVAPGRDACA